MDAFALLIDQAFAAGGQAALVDLLLSNADELRETCTAAAEVHTPPQPGTAPPPPPPPEPACSEWQCPHCYGFNVRDDTFTCMRTCADCATCWHYMTNMAAACLDYDDMVKAKEKVSLCVQIIKMIVSVLASVLTLTVVLSGIACGIAVWFLHRATRGSSAEGYSPSATVHMQPWQPTTGNTLPPPSLVALLPSPHWVLQPAHTHPTTLTLSRRDSPPPSSSAEHSSPPAGNLSTSE